ncbi:helix-turn-helix transcriptional regulator [Streptomyces sp. NPDC096040]|uniref:helix-turn-helix domain-containing protein n=1 Tax=Streptomyces sp. NPDC096040 TaxID=3155541 RepID=UPI003328BB9A
MTTNLTIGERVAWYRRRRGMSQEVLAGLVGRTVDWLSKAENNRLELDRLSVIKALADALDVSLGDLLAEPTLMEWTPESGNRTVPALRSALMNYRQLTPLLGVPTEGAPTPLDELRASVVEIMDAYQASRYGFATRRLPLVLADALIAAQSYNGRDREQANELLALTYQSAAMVLGKVGEVDLAWIAADRGLGAAQQSGNPAVIGSLFRSVGHCLLSTARFDAAVQLIGDASDYLRPGLSGASPEFLSIYGTLFLAGSMAAARAEERSTVREFLAEADQAARRLGQDANHIVDRVRADQRRHPPRGHRGRAGRHAGSRRPGAAYRHQQPPDGAPDATQHRGSPCPQRTQPSR